MDKKVLKFQNQKLGERIEMRKKVEEDLRKRIEQLEQRQTTDDAVLCIVNRCARHVCVLLHIFFYCNFHASTFYVVTCFTMKHFKIIRIIVRNNFTDIGISWTKTYGCCCSDLTPRAPTRAES